MFSASLASSTRLLRLYCLPTSFLSSMRTPFTARFDETPSSIERGWHDDGRQLSDTKVFGRHSAYADLFLWFVAIFSTLIVCRKVNVARSYLDAAEIAIYEKMLNGKEYFASHCSVFGALEIRTRCCATSRANARLTRRGLLPIRTLESIVLLPEFSLACSRLSGRSRN